MTFLRDNAGNRPRGVDVGPVGSFSTAHLNLTKTLRQAWNIPTVDEQVKAAVETFRPKGVLPEEK